MLKLQTIIELRDNINKQVRLLSTLSEDYLDMIDDDLWTIDLESRPSFTDQVLQSDKLMVTFNAEKKLTEKYLKRFCDDFGLKLNKMVESSYGYEYFFEVDE